MARKSKIIAGLKDAVRYARNDKAMKADAKVEKSGGKKMGKSWKGKC